MSIAKCDLQGNGGIRRPREDVMVNATATEPIVLFERRGRVGLITLNRPDRLNAWTRSMGELLHQNIEACNADDRVGAIVITGAGRGFCSGADLRPEPAPEGAPARPPVEAEPQPLFLQRSKPLIAAINGAAIGAGLTLPLGCDIRIASDKARFSMRFVRIGLTPEWGSTFFLPQIVGLGYAAELILSGRIIDAAEADRIGLVNRVVPHDQLLDVALALADEIAFNPTAQLRWAKRLLHHNAADSNTRAVLLSEDEVFAQAMRSDAFAEAGNAFRERREPTYHG
ncbi:MAG: enoyl-CoA hydratase/isomerase family protein [Dehalococcoidia bacterium]